MKHRLASTRSAIVAAALVFCVTVQAWAAGPGTVIISDIDDTIQLTQIKPAGHSVWQWFEQKFNLLINVMKNHDAFVGMPYLYNAAAESGATIEYVSGAPEFLARLPQLFLKVSGFPDGRLSLKPSRTIPTFDYKVAKIAEVMRRYPSETTFVLVGDNGEYDVSVYAALKRDPEFRDRIQRVFIHNLYPTGIGEDLAEGQDNYLTAADLALKFYDAGLITHRQVTLTLQHVENSIDSRYRTVRNRSFPNFATLRGPDLAALHSRLSRLIDPEQRRPFESIIATLELRPTRGPVLCREVF